MSRTKEQMVAAIENAKDKFQTATYGEDVRGGMVDIADVVEEAVEDQLIEVDTTLSQSGAGADAKATGDELNLCLRAVGSIASTDDLDLLKNTSGMYYCSSDVSALASHTPWDNKAFALFVKSGTTPAATSGQAQFAINSRGEFACRFHVGGAWSAWKFYNTSDDIDSMMALTMVARESIASTDDLDLFKSTSGMYYCSQTNAALAFHVPWNNKAFALFVKSGTLAAATSGQAQFAISWSGEFACRFYAANAWSSWHYLADKDDVSSTFVEMDLSLFSSIAVCGGSYDSGYSYNSAGTGVTNYNNAWLKILSRKHGFTGNVYAAHGTSIDEWFDPSYSQASHCYAAFAADTASQLYITTFGANDTISGSTADCAAFDADPTSTPTTFYGWYAKLIYTIRQKAAADGVDTRIILTTPSSEGIISSMTSRITAINEIAAYYDLPVMRWTNDPILSANLETFTSAGSGTNKHPTPYGYAIMASAFERLFGKCVIADASYFNDWRN